MLEGNPVCCFREMGRPCNGPAGEVRESRYCARAMARSQRSSVPQFV
jgi:hypothetical protein